MPKAYQLRVRLDFSDHEKLLRICSSQDKRRTLSDLVREAIKHYVDSDSTADQPHHFSLGERTTANAQQIANMLERPFKSVVEDCVQGIVDCFQDNKTPLIVQELRLRKNYFEMRDGDKAPSLVFIPFTDKAPRLSSHGE
jgi:hypothetical protein